MPSPTIVRKLVSSSVVSAVCHLACVLFPQSSFSQVPVRWYAESSRPVALAVDAWRGETLSLEPVMTVNGDPVAWPADTSVSLWWQTNGMGSAWWSSAGALGSETGALFAVWSPTNDVGAAAYTWFIRATTASGTSYRAAGTLRMQTSPGWNPSAAVLPSLYGALAADLAPFVAPLVCGSFASTNALHSASNALAAALQDLGTNAVPAAIAAAISNVTPASIGAATAAQGSLADTALQPADTNGWTTTAHAAWLATESDPIALAVMATQRVTRVWSEDGTQCVDATGGVWRVIQSAEKKWFYTDGSDGGAVTTAVPSLSYPLPDNYFVQVTSNATVSCITDETYQYYCNVNVTDYVSFWDFIDPYSGVYAVDGGNWASLFWVEVAGTGMVTQHVDSVVFSSRIGTNGLVSSNALNAAIAPLASTNAPTLQNPTLGGAVTIGGVARNSWPDGGTSTIYATVSTSAATVVIAPSQTVYGVTLDTASVISNDLSAVDLGGQIARWTEYINLTTTNALDSTWATNTVWAGGVPSLTVTGTYVYACSSLDGVSVVRKQTFPSVHSPSAVSFVNGVSIGADEVPPVLQSIRYGLAFATNNLGCLVGQYRGYKILLSVNLQSMSVVLNPAPYGGSLQVYNTSASIPFEMSWRNIGHDVLSGVVDCTVIDTTYRTIALVKIAGESYTPTVLGVTARILNELELAHVNAGGKLTN